MIYSQDFVFYLLAFILTIVIGIRLHSYLKEFFSSLFSAIVTLAVILHPLSIDAFLAPNFIAGSLAFLFFLESLIFLKKEKHAYALGVVVLASVCNLAYGLFPLYYVYTYRKQLSKFYVPAGIYLYLFLIYFFKLFYLTPHNPLIFFSHFSLKVLAPFSLSFFDYSTFPFSPISAIISISLLIIFLRFQQIDSRSTRFWPMLFFPLIAVFSHQWIGPYQFWHEVILTPSNFLCITFALVVMLAIHLPKEIFVAYFIVILALSYDWGTRWSPTSNLIWQSVIDLPSDYKETLTAKRVLAWQFLYEKKTREAEEMLRALLVENPGNEDLNSDLKLIKERSR